MNVAKRTKALKALLDIRIGPGAALLPTDVKRLHLTFARKINDGHYGARKVWRNYLPRLKYHNPAISITLDRSIKQEDPATLTIFFAQPLTPSTLTVSTDALSTDSSSTLSAHPRSNKVETIDIKNKHETEILSRLLELTNETPYEVSQEEKFELMEVEDYSRNSERDREAQAKLNEATRQERALLEQARGAVTEVV